MRLRAPCLKLSKEKDLFRDKENKPDLSLT